MEWEKAPNTIAPIAIPVARMMNASRRFVIPFV
jgi:hypothetical protein